MAFEKKKRETHFLCVVPGCMQELNIYLQYLHFAQTEDIGLKSAVLGENVLAMITGRK